MNDFPANQTDKSPKWAVWGGIFLTALILGLGFLLSRTEQSPAVDLLPISTIPDVTLTNQDSRPIALSDLRGSVWVADIIFTRCAGPCPVMTGHMSELQSVLPAHDSVKLVTLTTDPENDRPEVLKRYGERFKADFKRWIFLTGSKEQIARVATDGLKLAALEKKPDERETAQDLFIHSQLFVFVDKQGRLRGSVDSYDPKMKNKVLAVVKVLLNEK